MKRGFLNSSKARAKMASDTPASKKPATGPIEFHKARYGVVENAGLPEGYKPPDLGLREALPTIDPSTLPEDLFMVASLPSIPLDSPPTAWDDGWTSCMLQAKTKAKIVSTPGFPSPIVRPPEVRHRIGPAAGMGLGAFSTAQLQPGDLILCERALIMAPGHLFGCDDLPSHFTAEQIHQTVLAEAEQYLRVVVDRLDPEDEEAYMALANSHLQDGSGPIVGIMRTNGIYGMDAEPPTQQGDPPMPYSAVCKEISRLNHSCCPNTAAVFDVASFSFRLFALCDIAPGEELTYSYMDISAPTAMRQEALAPYGFRCTCRACRDPASDARRATIRGTKVSAALMKAWAAEGLHGSSFYFPHALALMERYISRGDADNALVWGRLLTKMTRWDSRAAMRFSDPVEIKSHPLWRKGVRA